MKNKNILIAYDITSPKRLGRIHRYLKNIAIPVQYSIFVTRVTERQLHKIIKELRQRINSSSDDVRIYEIPSDYQADLYGCQAMPEEIMLMGLNLEKLLGGMGG